MKTRLSTIFFLLNILSISAFAQNNLSDTISLEEIVVTGTKIEVSRKLVPLSVSQITIADIENTGEINILPTMSTYAPGVFVTERNILGFGVSTGASGTISIRGIGGSPNTSVLVLIDGHPQYQGIFGHPLPDAYVASDVEKIEIIRGAASILYGSNAMGGVVNIITKQQQQEGIKANIEASYGSFNTQKYSGTIGYKNKKISAFASINHDQTDGLRKNTDFNSTNGYTKFNFEINKHIQLTADFNLAKFNANDDGPIYAAYAQPFHIDITRGKAALSIEDRYSNMDGALKLYHNFGTHDLSDGWYSTDRNSGLAFYQTIRLCDSNKLTAGFDAKQYGGKANSGVAKDSTLIVNELAVYAYMQQTIARKISLSAGLRLEHNSNYGLELIPMAGINYNPTQTSTIKASVSKGFRSPTVMEMYLFAPNPELKPEQIMNYELSWLQSFYRNRIETEVTVFKADGHNLIQVTGQYPNVKRENIGTFSNSGIEMAAKIKASKNLFFHANYSYLKLDKAVIAAPKQQFNLSANYSYSIFSLNLSLQSIRELYTSTSPEITQNYTLINARLNAKVLKNANLFFMVNNLLNQDYEINYGYPMPKLNFSTGIKFSF